MKNLSLLQIRYYNGEESSHEFGFGVAPVNLGARCWDIENNYAENQINKNSYFVKNCILKLYKTKDFSGDLGVRLIGESVKGLEKSAKFLKLPFLKKAVVPYSFLEENN
ncbi:hypothetical protein KAT80_01725 [Candidatus Pacearchaeota archaeon]|nr:hypothetical protein [Candidatus Pacearchaeota archaeon]